MTVYNVGMGEKVYDFMKTGNSISAASEFLGVHRDTLYDWEQKHPEFKAWFLRARQASCVHWEKVLESMTLEQRTGSAQYKAVELILANRFRDLYSKNAGKQEIEITHKELSEADLDIQLAALLAKTQTDPKDITH